MSIFSKVKKAKKAAEDHKKAATTDEEPKPPPTPYKHIVSHAAQDALAATPTTWSAEETRAKIAAARKTRDEIVMAAPVPVVYSRTNSEKTIATRSTRRSQSDLSIDSVMQRPGAYKSQSRPSLKEHPALRQEHNQTTTREGPPVLPNPRHVPLPPMPRHRPSYSTPSASSSSSNMRRRSPLANITSEEEPEEIYRAPSAKTSETCSSASSESSFVEMARKQRRFSQGAVNLPIPSVVPEKYHQVVATSVPYTSVKDFNTAIRTVPAYENLPSPDFPAPGGQATKGRKKMSRLSIPRNIFRRQQNTDSSIAAH